MEKLNLLIIFSILMVLTSCKSEQKTDTNANIVEFEKSELFGRWIRTNKIENLKDPEDVLVGKFNLKDDSTAEIEILDSIGYETVTGSWKIDNEQKVGPFSFKSDIALTFDRNNNHRQIILLPVKELNEEKILTAHKGKFEKE